jgi:hypothetical protein
MSAIAGSLLTPERCNVQFRVIAAVPRPAIRYRPLAETHLARRIPRWERPAQLQQQWTQMEVVASTSELELAWPLWVGVAQHGDEFEIAILLVTPLQAHFA